MTPTIQSNGRGAPWKRLSRGDVGFALAVLGAYVVATVLAIE